MGILKSVLRRTINSLLPRHQRGRLGAFLTNEACGDNDDNPATNGEYALLKSFFKNHCAERCIALDAGANLGEWTHAVFQHAGRDSRVFSFEPVPSTFKKLQEGLSSEPRSECINAALGDQNGKAQIHVTGDLAGSNSLYCRHTLGMKTGEHITVDVVTGDAFCAGRGIERVDIVKIDTEGHEIHVLKGFEKMLSEKRLRLIQFEYGGAWLDARAQLSDAFALLQPKGYLIAKVFPGGLKFIDVYEQRLDSFSYANYVALLPELKGAFSLIA